jgi:hypothetical protein
MVTITKFNQGDPYEEQWGANGDPSNCDIEQDVFSDKWQLRFDSPSYDSQHAVSRAYIVSDSDTTISTDVSLPTDLSGTYTLLFGVQNDATWNNISCYGLRLRNGDQQLELIRRDNGSETSLDTFDPGRSYAGFTELKIRWNPFGNDGIEGFVDGFGPVSATDSTYTSGGLGFHCNPSDLTEIQELRASSFTDNRPNAPGGVDASGV